MAISSGASFNIKAPYKRRRQPKQNAIDINKGSVINGQSHLNEQERGK
jgi:hypothetical protein